MSASVAGDSGVPPAGMLRATLSPSLLAGSALDSGTALLRFADRRVYVDSLRVEQPGLIATGSGSLGWTRGTRGTLALDFDADSLGSIDSLVSWFAGDGGDASADPPGEALSGSARVLLTLEGSLDSVALRHSTLTRRSTRSRTG